MNSQYLITNIKRIAIACMAIALIITSSMLLMRNSPPQTHTTTNNEKESAESGKSGDIPSLQVSDHDHLATINVIVLNNGKDLPLAITVGDKSIEIPGPSSWPKSGDGGATNPEKGRFLAGIIDTPDVLKANGFKPDDPYKISIGGTPLNASNTFRVVGNHQADLTSNNGSGYTEEFHSNPEEEGIWRSLKFKNIVLSYGQIPSLADFLVSMPISPNKNSMPKQTKSAGTSTLSYQNPEEMVAAMGKSQDEIQKYRDNMDSPDPALRAQALKNMVIFGDNLPTDESHPGIATYIEKALTDNEATVRNAALRALELWDGNIPLETLDRVVLNDQSPEIRIHAIKILVDRFSEQAAPTLQQASHDPDPQVAKTASEYLQDYPPQ